MPLDLFQPAAAARVGPVRRGHGAVAGGRPPPPRGRARSTTRDGKVSAETLAELAAAGYWGMLIDPKYGGQGAPFARFTAFLTRMASHDAMIAGLASVHGCIGAVDPVRTFGTPEQKQRFLPRLASGAGAVRLRPDRAGRRLRPDRPAHDRRPRRRRLRGHRREAVHHQRRPRPDDRPGRAARRQAGGADRRPAAAGERAVPARALRPVRPAARLQQRPASSTTSACRGTTCSKPPIGDGLTIAYHGLNLGRVALCAGAAGSMRVMLANMLPWAEFRRTYGQPIATRELVKRRIARLAGLIAGADALVAWGSWLIDQGYRGELECIIAKIFGSEAQKEAAIELFMKTHGGRSFLKGHLFGDNVYDFLAPCIYEGEGEMLGHGVLQVAGQGARQGVLRADRQGAAAARHEDVQPAEPGPRLEAAQGTGGVRELVARPEVRRGRDRQHVAAAWTRGWPSTSASPWTSSAGIAPRSSGAMGKHQLKLADRQCRMAEAVAAGAGHGRDAGDGPVGAAGRRTRRPSRPRTSCARTCAAS